MYNFNFFKQKQHKLYIFHKRPTFNVNTSHKLYISHKNATKTAETTKLLDLNTKESYKIQNVYIVSNLTGGGSVKYINDITTHYTNVNFIFIKNKFDLLQISHNTSNDILFVQQLLYTDIHPDDLLEIKNKFSLSIVISIHDFCWFISDNNINYPLTNIYEIGYLQEIQYINPSIIRLFENATRVIHPSKFTQYHYSRYFPINNSILQPHNDIQVDNSCKMIHPITNNTINVCNFQNFSEYKGSEMVQLLFDHYKNYKGYKINILIVGKNVELYNEDDWHNSLMKLNPHCLLHLNKYGETYSYCLSKSINSGLPILYNNIGVFRGRIPKNNEHYKYVIQNEYEYNNNELKLFKTFEKMLDYIIENQGIYTKTNNNNKIIYNNFYDKLFLTVNDYSKIYNKIKPFAIYFPQFHNIKENNINYYNGMSDILNLSFYLKNYKPQKEILDTPNLKELGITSLIQYNLTNKNIILNQIEIAKKNCIYGFAIYYYWFSINNITNNHTIMESCYNLFFEENIEDFKVFFIWANEDWSNNPAFNTNSTIINNYDSSSFKKNINNLMKYFKHPNYYKIDNKPVFYIHHPFLLTNEENKLFSCLLEVESIKNGFNGVYLVFNNLEKQYDNLFNYNFHPNYKKLTTTLPDYNLYIDNCLLTNDYTNCIFFDFNNSARLCNPNKLNLVTKFKNINNFNQQKYVNKILNSYKNRKNNNDEINKILLINSWNEWGENMSIEPGEINKYNYLNLLKVSLIKTFNM